MVVARQPAQSRLLDKPLRAQRPARRRPGLPERERPERQADRVLDQPPGAAGPGRIQHRHLHACSRRPIRRPARATRNERRARARERARRARSASRFDCCSRRACRARRARRRAARIAADAAAPAAARIGGGRAAAASAAAAAPAPPRLRPRLRPPSASPPPLAAAAPRRRAPAPAPRSRKSERVQITDPYIELRTGPGRGYPIFFVAPRNEWIEIELRHTDWFRVRTDDGKVGWVSRQQLETTLTAARRQKSFRDVLLDDYLSRKVQLGAAWGHFKSEPMLKVWTSYRLSDTLSLEAHARPGAGRVLGHRPLARQPAGRAVVRPALLAVLRRRRRQVQELPEPEPGRRADHQRQARRRASSACATTSPSASCCAPTTRSTPPSSAISARPNTTPGPPALSFFF